MTYTAIDFYDDAGISAQYFDARSRPDEGNVTVEEPAILEFAGSLDGAAVLDLGCGDGRFAEYARRSGAVRYRGVDGSRRMLDKARREVSWPSASWEQADLETWRGQDSRYDVIVSRMTMHYLAGLEGFLRAVRQSIAPDGVFVFSVEHPMVTSFYNGDFRDRIPGSWTVKDYFRQGARPCPWLGAEVLKRHRTFADYFTALTECGFSLSALSEGEPDRSRFSDPDIFECRKSIPMYAIFQARPRRRS